MGTEGRAVVVSEPGAEGGAAAHAKHDGSSAAIPHRWPPAPPTRVQVAGRQGGGQADARCLPSLGSACHATGGCKPCIFFYHNVCYREETCRFCHCEHSREAYDRVKLSPNGRRALLERIANLNAAVALPRVTIYSV